MKNKVGAVMAGLVVALTVAGCAGTKEAKRDVEAAIPGVSQKGEGLVQDVNADQNQLTVVGLNNKTTPVTFTISPSTEISKQGQRVALSDIQNGTPVSINYEPSTGPEKAYKIDILTGGEAAKVETNVKNLGYGGAGTQDQQQLQQQDQSQPEHHY